MSDHELQDRLTKLEVQVVEKWSAHDKRSDERWADLMENFHEMKRKLEHRPCIEHGELLLTIKHRTESIEKWQTTVNWAVGVIYVALIGAIAKHFLG